MSETIINIRNMVCPRCILVVKNLLEELNIQFEDVRLGEVILSQVLTNSKKEDFQKRLIELGFEIIFDAKIRLIEQTKVLIVKQIHYSEGKELKVNFSDFLSRELGKDYHYLSNLFSEIEKITIEKYIISQKIERVKELLEYDELNLSEIAYRMQYSSAAHLSQQFKKVTGFTPSQYKQENPKTRNPLDNIR